jgi:hypothetical protein
MRLIQPSSPVVRVLFVVSIVALAACSGSASPALPTPAATVPPAATDVASAPPDASDSQAPTDASAGPTAVPTSIDPCTLISAEEAGKLAGVTFKAGKETTTEGNARICTYGSATPNVFSVEVAIAPDLATAQAGEAAAQADLKASADQFGKDVKVTQLPGFATGADAVLMEATASLGGKTLGVRAIYLLRGTTFFGFSDLALDTAPPSADAMKSEATTVLGRLP